MAPKSPQALDKSSTSTDEYRIVNRIYAAVMEQRLAPKTKLSEPELQGVLKLIQSLNPRPGSVVEKMSFPIRLSASIVRHAGQ